MKQESVLTKDIHHLVTTVVIFQIKGVYFPVFFEEQVVVLIFHHWEVPLLQMATQIIPPYFFVTLS